MDDITHVLVLGTPRSGTSLLAAMIGRHPEVAMLYEDFGHAICSIVGKPVAGNKLCVPNQIELRRKRPLWVRLFGPRLFRALTRQGYFAYRPEALVSLEDYFGWQPLKLCATVRDGPAVISSIMKRGEQPLEVAAHRWCRGLEILDEVRARQGDDLLLISFKQLVSAPERVMRAVAEHLGLAFDPAMLEGHAHTPLYSNAGIDASKAEQQPEPEQRLLDVEERFPAAHATYERLLAHCLPDARPA